MSKMKGQPSIKDMMEKPNSNGVVENGALVEAKSAAKGKKKELEDIYVKKTQLEHILLRPDTYIGSVEFNTESMWVLDKETEKIVQKEITYVPGLYKIFDEILVNAADHKQRDPKMDSIKIDINQEDNSISIWNNGKGIPVSMHKGEKMFIPTMIFGHLLTSSNYDDQEKKVTGGRNGFGAKLCNIFSSKFIVETACHQFKKNFKQAWANNMSKTSEPKIKEFSGSEFTKITFSPDLAKFKMDKLDDDIVSLISRRAYDIAASARGVKVFLNGKRVPIKNFKDYVDCYLKDKEDEAGNPVKCVYESVNPYWEIAVALSEKGFQQMSFVNSIATTKGGRHIDYVTDIIVKSLVDCLKKKNKSGVNIKPFQIKNHLWIFVNALIVNPTFDSQTKENMTLQAKSFGSKCAPSDKFINATAKCGIVEAVMTWAKFKQQAQLQSKCDGKKLTKIKGIPKLEDANEAGTRNAFKCTLILTEGDSAKTLAVAGLGVVGRDLYGVFPLKGKLLNVREAALSQILENVEIKNMIKILGLQYKKKYETDDDFKTLRYGKLMIMTDQDHDGSHIKGLLINFIHHNWPSLLKKNFLEEFITPIVKATKGKEEYSFYSVPEFEEWKKSKNNWHTYKIKYYKGLGTSTSKEAKEYFQDMVRHRIIFKHEGNQDDHAIQMAFSKKAIEQRKEWLTSWMEEGKRRKELGLPEVYLYEKDTRFVNYSDFINKELVLFSNLDNERSIPSMVDGLKPGQRKVLFTCLKRNDKKEIKVAQLAGSVAEHSAYHHGEASLMSTIINLAHNFVGSNNINILKPIGQFGTRLLGGKDAASPRYIFTQLSSLTRYIFDAKDEAILNFLKEDNQKIEPEWYLPIIPMVLVNGAEGIGTGWSTKIPNYNPREIVSNIKIMINGEEPRPMKPWFKNFKGEIEELDQYRCIISGEVAKSSYCKYEITELPIRTWTQVYKEGVMELLYQGSDKSPSLISEYREYHTDTTVKFVVTVPEDKVDKVDAEGPHKVFKLQSSTSLSSMVLFDPNGCLKKYESVTDILKEFFELRMKYYEKRKVYLVGMLEAEANKLSNQARFILEKCDGRLTIENKKKKDMISELQRKGYDSDSVKAWQRANIKNVDEDDGEFEEDDMQSQDGLDYDYLLGMTMWSLTKEKKDDLLKKKDEKIHELETLKKKSPSGLWIEDLDNFLKELESVEQLEREDESAGKKEGAAKGLAKRKKLVGEVLPSPHAERIIPRIDAELKKKAEKAAQAKVKGKRDKKASIIPKDEFDEMLDENTGKSLAERVGTSPAEIDKEFKEKSKKLKEGVGKLKQTKLNFKPKPKGKMKLTVDTDEEMDDYSDAEMDFDIQPRERKEGRRAVAQKKSYKFSDSENESDNSVLSFHSNKGVDENESPAQNLTFEDSVIDNSPPKKKNGNAKEIVISDTDSDFDGAKISKKETAKKPQEQSASDMFDSLIGSSSPEKIPEAPKSKTKFSFDTESDDDLPMVPLSERLAADDKPKEQLIKKRGPKKTAAAPKRKIASDSEDDDFNKKPKKGKAKVAKKKKKADSSEEDFNVSDSGAGNVRARATTGRGKTAKKYAFSSESESDF